MNANLRKLEPELLDAVKRAKVMLARLEARPWPAAAAGVAGISTSCCGRNFHSFE